MLYQTHHPHFFPIFHPHPHSFTSIPLSATTPTIPIPTTSKASSFLLPSSSSGASSSSLTQEMECVDAALKTSIKKEMALKSSPQAFFDDLWALNSQNVVAGDDFFVDDLLDFSNEDNFVEQQPHKEEEKEGKEENGVVSVSAKNEPKDDENNSNGSLDFDGFGPIPAGVLAVPTDDVENLEWLSHFVEDSFSEYSAPFPAVALPVKPKGNKSEREKAVVTNPCFTTPVPAKARSKRTRTGGRVWSLGSPSLTDSSSSSTSSSSSSPSSPWLICTNPGSVPRLEPSEPALSEKPVVKKQKKREGLAGATGVQLPRRCSHCGVQKTPQWRTGPLGAKTLCNACGVRYKSGRLLPEYRPACSPTFSSELHSNHHRKVLEMRRKKESLGDTEPGLTPPAVPSF